MPIVAVFGGAFNPPHVGHAMVASWVKLTGLADEVWFVPSASHPFGKKMAPFDVRVAMCAALASELGVWASVSKVEQHLPAPNYTLDLLRHFRLTHLGVTFRFIMGSDNLNLMHKWHGFDDILAEFDPIFVQRVGSESWDPRAAPHAPVFPNVSSTEVRHRMETSGGPVSHLVPSGVLHVIRREGLYRWYE